jgi:hypothetical protein
LTKQKNPWFPKGSSSCGDRIRTYDLQVMSLAS